ncbi:hypothetical protein ACP4OV_028165 [Aristida adscensionis]
METTTLHLAPSSDESSLPDLLAPPPPPPDDDLPPAAASLPVVDLSRGRAEVRRAVLAAGRELGLFQVVNHGVPEQTLRDMEAVSEEFFRLPAAEKAAYYSEDKRKRNRFFSGTTYETGGESYRLDCLRLAGAFPLAAGAAADWPDKPRRLREAVAQYMAQGRGVAMEVLRLLCEAMGLPPDYFDGDLSGGDVVLGINHYPRCPEPEPETAAAAALGLPPHCDRNLITVILPGPVPGLEVAYNGGWIRVEPVPNALLLVLGLQLEVVTNGLLKSNEHRVMTNPVRSRTSVAMFIEPTADCLVGPAEEFISEDNPPCYRTLTFADFKRIYSVVKLGSSLNLTTNLKDNQKQVLDELKP